MNAKIGLILTPRFLFTCTFLPIYLCSKWGSLQLPNTHFKLFSHASCREASNVPFTVRETSFSAAPTRGTTARHTYFPASSCLTDFSVRMFSLLSTCSRRSKIKTLKMSAKGAGQGQNESGLMGGQLSSEKGLLLNY